MAPYDVASNICRGQVITRRAIDTHCEPSFLELNGNPWRGVLEQYQLGRTFVRNAARRPAL
jgi:hypothetical protein